MSRTTDILETPLNATIRNFSESVVPAMSRESCSFFNSLYTGKEVKNLTKETSLQDEMIFTSVKEVIRSTSNPEKRAQRLVNFVKKTQEEIKSKIKNDEGFVRNEKEKKKIDEWINKKFISIIDASLLLKDALDLNLFTKEKVEKKKIVEYVESNFEKDAKTYVNLYLNWTTSNTISNKLPNFNDEEEFANIGLFQQLNGKIPVEPISEQILPFSLLEWQRNMFKQLRERKNVIVCAPTSSGKTMVATGYVISFLYNELKSLLVYVVPNEVLGLEISALLSKYVKDRVSTILDKSMDRKQDERVIVCTPKGAFNSGLIYTKLPEDALLVVDETHCIGNKSGVYMEYVLRRLSSVQTLILSATMTLETIEKMKLTIRNKNEIVTINETTKFIVPQYMIPKSENLVSINPIGSVTIEELNNPDMDISMTPRDVLALYVKIVRTFGLTIPEYLNPISFFYIHNCKIPETTKPMEEEDDELSGTIKRLSMEHVANWQKALIKFLTTMPENQVQQILDSFKSSLTDKSTSDCTPENSYKLVEQLKEMEMLQAIFFFPSLFKAFQFAKHIYLKLHDKKTSGIDDKKLKAKEIQLQSLRKQLRSLQKMNLKPGTDVKAHKERVYEIKQGISDLESDASSFHAENALNPDRIISPDGFEKLTNVLKKWNSNITISSALSQMVIYGIGILSGDMPAELQVKIRELYSSGEISLLMTTEDCAYGINTPTKTVILSDGFTETQRRQMGGRAGRKGLSYDAWIISFRLNNPDEAGQKLKTLQGESIKLYAKVSPFPREDTWITKFTREPVQYKIKDDLTNDKLQDFHVNTRFLYGHCGTIGPQILETVLNVTKGQTNRHLKIILSILPLTPFDKPFRELESWTYEIPQEVKRLYIENSLPVPVPNNLLYSWLTNQRENMSNDELEMFVENAKYWIYLFHLMEPFFTKDEKAIHKIIMDLFTKCMIDTSIGL